MAELLPPIVADERIVWRKRVLRGGKVVYGEEGEFTLDCLIHDVSESGARISLKPNEFIPTMSRREWRTKPRRPGFGS
jgi:hypothetical protein